MAFQKTATVEVLGVQANSAWERTASQVRVASHFMEDKLALNIEAILDTVADTYRISRDPKNYLLIPCRACSADRPNENMDGWKREELLRFDPRIGRRVYSTFVLKPHFVNHNSSNFSLSRGVLLDAHFNDRNPASDAVKRAVFEATGKDVTHDEFVETLIAADITKDPFLAEAYKNGAVYRFSMGCDVTDTECSVCGKVASTKLQFCEHVRGKHSRRAYPISGGERKASEWCRGTVFAELSAVDDPADKDAEIQEGLLRIAMANPSLTDQEIHEISSFVARNASQIPESLAGLINSVLSGR
jgi:hypothetical protein